MAATNHPLPGCMRSAVLASADLSFRMKLRDALTSLRWQVREASGGAETLACLEDAPAETVVLDSWLPDLEIREFISEFERLHPEVDLVIADASTGNLSGHRSPRRNEVLHALRQAQCTDDAAWNAAPEIEALAPSSIPEPGISGREKALGGALRTQIIFPSRRDLSTPDLAHRPQASSPAPRPLPEMAGSHPSILEVCRRVQVVAPRATPVLIQGPTGSGKELVARAIHRLSPRAQRKLVALNCAAIPESLLEAELFGHTRGAFTGAVQGRVGRIEAAHGGTLFLDEIGEMPLPLQAKLLRFLETGEVQRVGDNENVRVDARIVAATHRPLARLTAEGLFRADLFYRLSVFLIRTPALAGRKEDILELTERFMEKLSRTGPARGISPAAQDKLTAHPWPGNVRELQHVLERAWILTEDRPEIAADDIEFDMPE